MDQSENNSFPPGFLWGVATSALQIEGNLRHAGGGVSSWERFAQEAGRVRTGATPAVACDHLRRWREDVQLMRELGVKAYRFSISWPRIFPDGDGVLNAGGLDFYEELTDALLAAGIEPWLTVFHWETPDRLEREWGGWRNVRTAEALGDFAACVAARLSDRITHFLTVNEIPCFTRYAYGADALYPPAVHIDDAACERVVLNGVLGHAYAAQAIRANARRPLQIGFADNPHGFVPVTPEPRHIAAARRAMRCENAAIATLIMEGDYPEYGAPQVRASEAELALIRASRPDFMGLNIYSGRHVAAADTPAGYELIPYPASYPRLAMPWLQMEPASLYWSVRFAAELWRPGGIYITENGCAASDEVRDRAGMVMDTDRMMYLRENLRWARRATAEGWPLRGYFHWSLLDNFEWCYGYEKRFGLVEVEPVTLNRRPKLSAEFYAGVIRHNGFDEKTTSPICKPEQREVY